MKTSRIVTIVAVLALAALAAGCSKAPTQTVQEAELAVRAVEDAGAAQYAPTSLAAANEAMAKLNAELAVQADKMSMMRRYGTAQELAVAAKLAADTALAETQAAKQAAHDAAVARIEAATAQLAVVRPMLATAPRGKGSEADLRLMEADLVGVESTLAEATAAVAAGDFISADAKATAATQSLDEVKTAIETAQALQAQRTRK